MTFKQFVALFVAISAVFWPLVASAEDAANLRSARNLIQAEDYDGALRTLRSTSPCSVTCKYLRAIVSSKFRDRDTTYILASLLIDDPAASPLIKKGAARLRAWASDVRIRQSTGTRTVYRETLGGLVYSDDDCTNSIELMVKWKQEWEELGVDPESIYVASLSKPCNLGSPIIVDETYSDLCEARNRRSVSGFGSQGWGYGYDFSEEEASVDGDFISSEHASPDFSGFPGLGGRKTSVVLESDEPSLDCAEFAPPEVDWEEETTEAAESEPTRE